jgi:hypothetical protein
MSIFRLYADNGHCAGFWIQHRTWRNTCAQVRSIAGKQSGRLPGLAPMHGGAQVVLLSYDVRSGRPIDLGPLLQEPTDRNFARIAQPSWYRPTRDEILQYEPARIGAIVRQ